jgi:hypothetical protein
MKRLLAAFALFLMLAAPARAGEATILFSSDAPLDVAIAADWRKVEASDPEDAPVPGVLTAGGETLAVEITTRGKSRRRAEVCDFPPLSVTFAQKPAEASLFVKQKKLKLVTFCRRSSSHEQIVLKEFAAYRLYNAVTPQSFRVRLLSVAYKDARNGKTEITRRGFFIEDQGDLARRVDMEEVKRGRTPVAMYDQQSAARAALFHYMIGNLDWDLTAGPPDENCCHNGKIIGPSKDAQSGLVSAPYDFDMSGFVDAPYSIPPEQINVTSVKTRVFRGFCSHNDETRAAAKEFLAARPSMEASLAATLGMKEATIRKAKSYLGEFFKAVADDAAVEKNLIKKCRD